MLLSIIAGIIGRRTALGGASTLASNALRARIGVDARTMECCFSNYSPRESHCRSRIRRHAQPRSTPILLLTCSSIHYELTPVFKPNTVFNQRYSKFIGNQIIRINGDIPVRHESFVTERFVANFSSRRRTQLHEGKTTGRRGYRK